MPAYEYAHINEHSQCTLGQSFEYYQSLEEQKLEKCPICKEQIRRCISPVRSLLKTHVTDSTLKDHGFTKLVKRDHGLYENVTSTANEPKYIQLQH